MNEQDTENHDHRGTSVTFRRNCRLFPTKESLLRRDRSIVGRCRDLNSPRYRANSASSSRCRRLNLSIVTLASRTRGIVRAARTIVASKKKY